MTIQNDSDALAEDIIRISTMALNSNTLIMTEDKGLADTDAIIQVFDPNGASRQVFLPVVSITNHSYTITNVADADETLTVLLNVGPWTTIGKVLRGETKTFYSNGTTWMCKEKKRAFLSIPAGAFVPSVDTGPSWILIAYTSSPVNIRRNSLAFDGATGEQASTTFLMPPDWDGGAVRFKFIRSHAGSPSGFGVYWQAFVSSGGDGEAMTLGSNGVGIADVGGATNIRYITGWTAPVTPGGTPTPGCDITVTVVRDPNNAADNLNDDARLIGVQMEYSRF